MITQEIQVTNNSGLHLRPASRLAHTAAKYKCDVKLAHNGVEANAKSVLSILGACVRSGEYVTITCTGTEESDAMKAIADVIANGLGEA